METTVAGTSVRSSKTLNVINFSSALPNSASLFAIRSSDNSVLSELENSTTSHMEPTAVTPANMMRQKSSQRINLPVLTPHTEEQRTASNDVVSQESSMKEDNTCVSATPERIPAVEQVPQPLSDTASQRIIRRMPTRDNTANSFVVRRSKDSNSYGVRRRVSSVFKMAGINLFQDEENHQGLWDVFDADGDGIIDYFEFCQLTCDLLDIAAHKKAATHILTEIEKRYIKLVQLELDRSEDLDKAMKKIFKKIDLNHSGCITQMEFEHGIRDLGLLIYNFEVHGQKRRFADTSFFIMNSHNRFRYWLVWIVEWKWFDRFILTCIVANSIMLAFKDYEDPGLVPDLQGHTHLSYRNYVVEKAGTLFSWIFAVESALKILAMGFLFGRGAYLRSYWNQLDFFVVVFGLIGEVPGVPKVSALRISRLLRPLRTLSNLRGMRMLIYALFSAIPALLNVMVIIGFIFTVFGILGVLFWNGALHYRCRTTPAPVNGIWELAGDGRICGGAYSCPVGQYCGSIYSLPANSTIDMTSLPSAEIWDNRLMSFDHIGYAMLTLFQCITLEGWTSVMYNFQDSHNWTFATIYFVIFTIIGAFFLLQFVFAVIWQRFNAANDGTAGDWDLILEERRASGTIAVPVEHLRIKKKSEIEIRSGQFQRKSGFHGAVKHGIQTTLVAVKSKNPISRIRALCRRIALNRYFSYAIVFCILFNTMCLAMDEYPTNENLENVTETLNLVLTFVFTLEMVLKLVGLGWKEYRADRYNLFDGIIVLISAIELILNLSNVRSKNSSLSALRTFRLFRIMKLARSWRSLRELVQTIVNSLADVANFGLLLLLLMYVFALIGMQFFATKYRFNTDGDPVTWEPHVYNYTSPPHAPWTPERPYTIRRSNFDDILAAFLTVFQCLTEESWNFVMYDGVRSAGWGAVVYFLAVMVIGNIIILNLFLAILLGNFTIDDQQLEIENALVRGEQVIMQMEVTNMAKVNAVQPVQNQLFDESSISMQLGDLAAASHLGKMPSINKHHHSRRRSKRSLSVSRNSGGRALNHGGSSRLISINTESLKVLDLHNAMISKGTAENASEEIRSTTAAKALHDTRSDIRTVSKADAVAKVKQLERFVTKVPFSTQTRTAVVVSDRDRSLFLFKKSNIIRRTCHAVIHNTLFDVLMFILIGCSSIQLAIDNPLNDPDSTMSNVLDVFEHVFAWAFLAEMILKVIDLGFVFNGRNSYLRDPWNALDCSILIVSVVTLFVSNEVLHSLRSIRALRALRPLRVISRVPGMKRVVNAMLSSIPCIMNVFLVCSLIFLIFGIIGVNLFKGRMYYCDMSSFSAEQTARLEDTYGFTMLSFKMLFSKANCLEEGGVWTLRHRNYNHVVKAAMTLFEIATTEGWVGFMYHGTDATEIDYHPVENWNRSYSAFFVAFIIIGNFFTLNLFVGAVIDNFNRMRETIESGECGNDTQREWLHIQDMIRFVKLVPKMKEPAHPLRKICFRLQQRRRFEALVAACVLLNTLMLATTHFQQSDRTTKILNIGNIFFWVVFLVEALIKLLAMGSKYFQDRWNLFDFAVVCGSTVSTILLPFITQGKVSPVANTLRAFRMGLAIRLMKRAKSMQDIVTTIMDNMPALINVSTLMFLIMFVYAVIGIQLYAGVMLGETLDEHANFKDVSLALITLFRFTTGEAWNDIMYDLMITPIDGEKPFPYGKSCVSEFTYADLVAARNYTGDSTLTIGCTPGIVVTYVYFLSYMLVTSYVLLNLFVAVILEGFEETTEKRSSTVTQEDLAHVCTIWEKYDPEMTGELSDHDFLKFLRNVPPPLGLSKRSRRKDVEEWAKQMNLYLEINDRITFTAFLTAASYYVMRKVAADRGDSLDLPRDMSSFFVRSQKVMIRRVRRFSSIDKSLRAVIAAKKIQSAMRTRLAKKEIERLKIHSNTYNEHEASPRPTMVASDGPRTELVERVSFVTAPSIIRSPLTQ